MRRDRFHKSHCPPAMWCFLLIFGIGFFFLLMDCDCDDGDPCTINSCVGICITSRVQNCCQTNNDCTDTLCNQALCDTSRNQCVLQPYTDGIACDDQDVCTVNDGCTGGFCVGIARNCSMNQCQQCTCDPVLGCMYTDVVDGTSCQQDSCSTSKCVSGHCSGEPMDCTHLDDHCGLGQCDDGKCVHVPGTDGTLCDDGLRCTSSDTCVAGVCTGVERQCFDNDPCTLNKCVEEVGNCLNLPIESQTCEKTCSVDSDCTGKFPWVTTDIQCRDGSCVDIPDDPSMVVRFLEYDMQQCYGTRYRMAMFFSIDTAVQKYEDGNRYRIASKTEHFDGMFPLGFPGEVVDIQSTIHGDRGRTTFTLHTNCKDLADPIKGCHQFTNMYYNFVVHLHDCAHLTTWLSCLDYTSTVNTYFNLSVVDCPIQEHIVQTEITGNLEVSPDTIHITVPMHVSLTVSEGDPWMTDIRICIPNMQTNLVECVLGTATQPCPNIGCFDWGSSESEALEMSWDVMRGGNITALAAQQIVSLQTCRYHENYNYNDKCENDGFEHGCTTDGFTITPVFFEPYLSDSYLNGGSLQAVIDVKFTSHFCGRRLQSGLGRKREISVINIV